MRLVPVFSFSKYALEIALTWYQTKKSFNNSSFYRGEWIVIILFITKELVHIEWRVRSIYIMYKNRPVNVRNAISTQLFKVLSHISKICAIYTIKRFYGNKITDHVEAGFECIASYDEISFFYYKFRIFGTFRAKRKQTTWSVLLLSNSIERIETLDDPLAIPSKPSSLDKKVDKGLFLFGSKYHKFSELKIKKRYFIVWHSVYNACFIGIITIEISANLNFQ